MSIHTSIRKYAIGMAFTCGMLMSSGLAQAATVTINFDTYLTGVNLGSGTLATLEADQVGSDVQMVFTNTFASQPASFDTQLFLGYLGSPAGVGLTYVSGVVIDNFENSGNPSTASKTFDMLVEWSTSNKDDSILRLNPGESSTFLLTNALLTSLFGTSLRDPFALIHLQGLTNDGSTKYTGSIACTANCGGPIDVVPLPGGILLLLSAIGGLGFLARSRKAGAEA